MKSREPWTCPVCRRTLHPRSSYDKKQHNGRRVHELALALLDKYQAMLRGDVTPIRSVA